MFERQIDDGRSFASYVVQQLLVWFASVLISILGSFPWIVVSGQGPIRGLVEALYVIASAAVPAFMAGRWVQETWPGFASEARAIWILPTMILIAGIVSSMDLTHFKAESLLAELLFPPSDGEAWWAVYFATAPAIGCLSYALGSRATSDRVS